MALPAATTSALPPIRVSSCYWPGSYWVTIASKKGWFKEAGLNVTLVDTGSDYSAAEKALVENRLDVNFFVLIDLLSYVARGADLVGIINGDCSSGIEKLIARPGIERITDLKGKRIALPERSYLRYIFQVALDRDGLTSDDVLVRNTPAEQSPELLIAGATDAILTYEPFATKAQETVKGNILFDTSQIPGLVPRITVFHRKFIEERRSDVTAFAKVWQRTTTFIKEHPTKAYAMIAAENKVTPEEVRQFAQIDRILDLRDNELAFSFAAGFDSLPGSVRQINDFMIARGMTVKQLDSSHFLDGSFIQALK